MDFIHKDLKTSIHDLVDLLRVELLSYGSEVSNICKEDGYQLPLSFNRAAGGENFIG
jgi:hypothetical protein